MSILHRLLLMCFISCFIRLVRNNKLLFQFPLFIILHIKQSRWIPSKSRVSLDVPASKANLHLVHHSVCLLDLNMKKQIYFSSCSSFWFKNSIITGFRLFYQIKRFPKPQPDRKWLNLDWAVKLISIKNRHWGPLNYESHHHQSLPLTLISAAIQV